MSIILLLRNEERFVTRNLESILSQLADRQDVEVICVDGASSDRTPQILADYARRDRRVQMVNNPRKITPTAMNIGIRLARGELVVFLGGHCEYSDNYLSACREVIGRTGADVVGGFMKTLPIADTPTGRAIASATSSSFGVGNAAFRTGGDEREVDTVPYGCYRREVFIKFGLFDERLVRNQDIELNTRIRRNGGRIVISPSIRMTYFNRSTLAGIRQQSYYNGLWNVYTLFLTGGGLRLRHFVPLAFVMGLIILSALTVLWLGAGILLAGYLSVYLLAAVLAARKAAADKKASIPLVVLAYLNLHLSYGFGSLVGLLTAPFRMGRGSKGPHFEHLPDRQD